GIRLLGITNGSPQLVVSRHILPAAMDTGTGWPHGCCYYYCGAPGQATNWPSGNRWLAQGGWSVCGHGPVIETGIGNPLEPGTYYIGIMDPYYTSSYTLQSRGIGVTNYTIRVQDLPFTGTITNPALAVGEAGYYRVVVPDGVPDWKLHLNAVSGRMYLDVQRNYLPNNGPTQCSPYGRVQDGQAGQVAD